MHSSPMLRFSLELYLSALRLHLTRSGFDRKLAVLNLAQSVELAVKATLVEENESIYEKGQKTLNTHDARDRLSSKWVKPFPFGARIELLVDERNAMQHRYGDVDELTLDYHIETVTEFLRKLLLDKFTENLDDYVYLTDPKLAEDCKAFIKPTAAAEAISPSGALDSDPIVGTPAAESPPFEPEPKIALVAEFMAFERTLRDRARVANGDDPAFRSTLDVTMKFAANVQAFDPSLVARIPGVFSLRNAAVHGTLEPTPAQLAEARLVLSKLIDALQHPGNQAELRDAVRANIAGIRGTKLRQPSQDRPSPSPPLEPE